MFFYNPSQQRHIVRILLMVPVFAVYSLLAYLEYHNAIYFQLFRDAYESIVVASFFHLLLAYLSSPPSTPDNPLPQPYATRAEREARLRAVFRTVHLENWMWPFRFVKCRCAGGGEGEGEAFMWWMRVVIGQFVVLWPLSTLVGVVAQVFGLYCEDSWSPK